MSIEDAIEKIGTLPDGQLVLTVEPDADGAFYWNDADTTGLSTDEVKDLVERLERQTRALATATDTLTAMRDADYRGNPPTSAHVAAACLRAIEYALKDK